MKLLPNILITGTPGVGKSTLCKELVKVTDFDWIDVSKFAIEHDCIFEVDNEFKCSVIDEDKVLDKLEVIVNKPRGCIIEYHSCDFFPERWFDGVFVLTATTDVLYDRLKERGYAEKKLNDNIMCEIYQTIVEEAKESYREEIVKILPNCNENEFKSNVNSIVDWIDNKWRLENNS